MRFTNYKSAVMAGHSPSMNPADDNYPDRDQIPEEYWRLECECCGIIGWEDATLLSDGSYVCNSCGGPANDDDELWNEDKYLEDQRND